MPWDPVPQAAPRLFFAGEKRRERFSPPRLVF